MAMEVGVVTEDGDVRVEDGEATEVGVMAGLVAGLVAGLWEAIGSVQLSDLSFRFLIIMDGSDFICWPIKCFQCRLFFTCSFVFQNVTSVLIRTLHRLRGMALVGIEHLTFRFEGLGTTIGPKSNFFSSSDLN